MTLVEMSIGRVRLAREERWYYVAASVVCIWSHTFLFWMPKVTALMDQRIRLHDITTAESSNGSGS